MGKQKIKFLLVSFVISVFALSGIGIGIFLGLTANELQASVLGLTTRATKKIKHIQLAKRFVAQLADYPEFIEPITICDYTPPEKPEYEGEFINSETKVWTDELGDFSTSLYLKNTGNIAWFSDWSGCPQFPVMRLGTARDRDRASIFYNPGDESWLMPNRITMLEPRVDPGEIATFTINANAPRVSDIFREYFQPVVEAKQWLDRKEETAQLDIYVGDVGSEEEKALFYLRKSEQASALDINGQPIIDVDISEQKMRFKLGDTVAREYTVSTGTFKTPTPLGKFSILNKQELRIAGKWPHYRMPMWQGFTKWGHGLHGLPYLANDKGIFWNEALNHIGQRVSHGCIRLLPEDAEDLYTLTDIATEMVIHN